MLSKCSEVVKTIMDFTFVMVLIFTVPFHFVGLVCNDLLSLIRASFSTVLLAGRKSGIF